MEKNYSELGGIERGTLGTLELDRGNGPFPRPARYEGFDENNKPRFYLLEGGVLLDVDKTKVMSFHPDGARRQQF
jgi:hypothetical protein